MSEVSSPTPSGPNPRQRTGGEPASSPSESHTPTSAPRPLRRSRPYLRLLWLLPTLAMLGAGLWFQYEIEEGGTVEAIKLSTKQGMVGQVAEAVATIKPSTDDLYIRVITPSEELRLPTYSNTPIGNGLIWALPRPLALGEVQRIDVWDHNAVLKDTQVDRITINGWAVDGGVFRVELQGRRIEPPKWAMPLASVGGALALVVLLRFVWDQVI